MRSALTPSSNAILLTGVAHTSPHRLRTAQFSFSYRFDAHRILIGRVEGDLLRNLPNLVFNLRQLSAKYRDTSGQYDLTFDTVFGQFSLDFPGVLFSGTDARTGSFFSFNYRGHEATVFDSTQSAWIAGGWNPNHWHVEEFLGRESLTVAQRSLKKRSEGTHGYLARGGRLAHALSEHSVG